MIANFNQTPVVRIEINWSRLVDNERKVQRLAKQINDWCHDNQVMPRFRGMAEPGYEIAYYMPEEGQKLIAFLRELMPESNEQVM